MIGLWQSPLMCPGPVHAITYSSSPGTYVLAGSADRSIRLYNPSPDASSSHHSSHITKPVSSTAKSAKPPQGKLIQVYSAHGYEVLSLTCSQDNRLFASAGGDRAVFLWDVATATTVRRFGTAGGGDQGGHTARVNAVSFAGESDSLLVSGSFDTTVRIWDVKAGSARPVQTLSEARDAVTCVAVRGADIVVGSVDGRVRAYDVRNGRCTTDVIGASVTSLSLTRDARAALVASLDGKLRLMDREVGACLRTYADPARRNGELRVQALLGGKETFVVAGDELAISPEEQKEQGAAAVPDGEGRIWAWDLLTGKVVAKVPVPWGPEGYEGKKRAIGRDGKERPRRNVISCLAWREDGWGNQFCVGGTSGVVTVFGSR